MLALCGLAGCFQRVVGGCKQAVGWLLWGLGEWSSCWQQRSMAEGFNPRVCQQNLVAWVVAHYLGFKDNSTGAERVLSRATKLHLSHLGPLQDNGVTLSMLVELDIDGPAAEEDFAERFFATGDEKPQLRATALSLELAGIWRSTYGNRFRLYKERKDKGKTREKRKGTESSICRNQVKAADHIYHQLSKQVSKESRTVLGVSREHLPRHRPLADNPQNNENLERLFAAAAKTKAKKIEESKRRQQHPSRAPYPAEAETLRKASLICIAGPPGASDYLKKPFLQVIDLCTAPTQSPRLPQQKMDIFRPCNRSSPTDVLTALRRSDLVVISSWRHLQAVPKPGDVPSEPQLLHGWGWLGFACAAWFTNVGIVWHHPCQVICGL